MQCFFFCLFFSALNTRKAWYRRANNRDVCDIRELFDVPRFLCANFRNNLIPYRNPCNLSYCSRTRKETALNYCLLVAESKLICNSLAPLRSLNWKGQDDGERVNLNNTNPPGLREGGKILVIITPVRPFW